MMPPTGEAYEVDWILSNSSNAHIATHRDWFTTFTVFDASIYCSFRSGRCRVLGIGDVHLEVKINPNSTERWSRKTLILHDVLYCPDLAYNILGGHIHDDFPLGEATTRLVDVNGETGCVFDRVEINESGIHRDHKAKLWLEGHRQGYFSAGPGLPWKQAIWPGDEIQKWEDYKAVYGWSVTVHETSEQITAAETGKPRLLMRVFSVKRRRKGQASKEKKDSCASSLVTDGVTKPPPYTQEERCWLREHYGEDFKFNGVSLLDENCTDGRRTMPLIRRSTGKNGIRRFGSLRVSKEIDRVTSLIGKSARRSDSWSHP